VPKLTYRTTAVIQISIESCNNGRFYIYEGTSRYKHNITAKYSTSTPQNFEIPVEPGALIVFMTTNNLENEVR